MCQALDSAGVGGSLIEESSMHRYIYITVHIEEGREGEPEGAGVCESCVD